LTRSGTRSGSCTSCSSETRTMASWTSWTSWISDRAMLGGPGSKEAFSLSHPCSFSQLQLVTGSRLAVAPSLLRMRRSCPKGRQTRPATGCSPTIHTCSFRFWPPRLGCARPHQKGRREGTILRKVQATISSPRAAGTASSHRRKKKCRCK